MNKLTCQHLHFYEEENHYECSYFGVCYNCGGTPEATAQLESDYHSYTYNCDDSDDSTLLPILTDEDIPF